MLSLDDLEGGRELETFGARSTAISLRNLPYLEPTPLPRPLIVEQPMPSPWTPAPPAQPAPAPWGTPRPRPTWETPGWEKPLSFPIAHTPQLKPIDIKPVIPYAAPTVNPIPRTDPKPSPTSPTMDPLPLTATMTPVERASSSRTAVVVAGVVLLLLIVAIAATS